MSLSIFAYAFIWPMSDVAQLLLFVASNVWTFLLRESPGVSVSLLSLLLFQFQTQRASRRERFD